MGSLGRCVRGGGGQQKTLKSQHEAKIQHVMWWSKTEEPRGVLGWCQPSVESWHMMDRQTDTLAARGGRNGNVRAPAVL